MSRNSLIVAAGAAAVLLAGLAVYYWPHNTASTSTPVTPTDITLTMRNGDTLTARLSDQLTVTTGYGSLQITPLDIVTIAFDHGDDRLPAPPPAPPAPSGLQFSDRLENGAAGPTMVIIPAGTLRLGAPNEQPGRRANEAAPQEITVERPFALSQTEITFADYDRFALATERDLPYDQDWGRDRRPVINVSWHDAMAYAEWLSRQTGKRYRLPSELEWEYAARAGADAAQAYWWGNTIGTNNAVCKGCGAQADLRQTAPVGGFPANGYGLFEVLGNVWEWTCSRYRDPPPDTLAVDDCEALDSEELRTIRGGSYLNPADRLRLAARDSFSPADSNELVGFRLLREL